MDDLENIDFRSTLSKVLEFHDAFKQPIRALPTFDIEDCALRIRLIAEELGELAEALGAKDQLKTLDALTDLQYVLDGAYITLGYYPVKEWAFSIVHDANMKKIGGVIREDGKILKPEGWQPPDLTPCLEALNDN